MAYTTAAVMGGGKTRPKLTDFLLRWTERRTRQSAEEQLNVLKALAARQKGMHGDNR